MGKFTYHLEVLDLQERDNENKGQKALISSPKRSACISIIQPELKNDQGSFNGNPKVHPKQLENNLTELTSI